MEHTRHRRPRRWAAALLGLGLVTAACSSSDGDPEGAEERELPPLDVVQQSGCEVLDAKHCLLPFPSDHFTIADDATDTGLRVAFPADLMPVNVDGLGIDPTEWNRNDGFSPGAMLLTSVPDVDLAASGAAPVTDMAQSLSPASPIVIVDADTGELHPHWAELDANAPDDADRLLLIRPVGNFAEGHRYVVGLRNLVDASGATIAAPDAFARLRDGVAAGNDEIDGRAADVTDMISVLEGAGVERDDLYLAWDFTIASERGLSERLLHLRDDAFADLGDAAPAFTVDSVSGEIASGRTVTGTYEVPLYLTGDGGPGTWLDDGDEPDGLATAHGTFTSRFICTVPGWPEGEPRDAPTGVIYGHGLLGGAEEAANIGALIGSVSNTITCGTDWVGMSRNDLGNVAAVLADLSTFGTIPDRLQQAHLNFLFLGRLLLHEDGLTADPAFQDGNGGTPAAQLAYIGGSQGGILGGATTAIGQDFTRSVLAVPGMNYSTMLRRSIDFDEFSAVMAATYPDPVDQVVGLGLVQMLWDRGEANGYAHHMTDDPYPDTPAHQVLLLQSFGDHQVANVATENLARTIGAEIRQPALAEGRSTDLEPFWSIPAATLPATGGSYLLVWDFGTPAPPTDNTPPREGEDPHGKISEPIGVLLATQEFLNTGSLVDTCAGAPCQTLD